MNIELLNKSELAAKMKRGPNYVTAMIRAGYQMEFGDQTTLSHALAWRRKNWPVVRVKRAVSIRRPERTIEPTTKKRSRSIPMPIRALVLERDKVCQYCGADSDLTLDHKLAFSKGGDHSPENLIAACFSCNIRKRTMGHEEFIKIASFREPVGGGRVGKVERVFTADDVQPLMDLL